MTISVNRFNSALKSANSQITSQTVEDATSSIVEQQKALNECKAGAIGDVQNGIKLLSENPINNTISTKKPIVGKLTNRVGNIKLSETLSNQSSIENLTGVSVKSGTLKNSFTSTSPKAVKAALEKSSTASPDRIENFLTSVSTNPSIVRSASNLLSSSTGLSSSVLSAVATQKTGLNNLLGNPANLLKTPSGLNNEPFNQLANFVSVISGLDVIKNIGSEVQNVFDNESFTYLGGGLNVEDKFDTSITKTKVIDEFGKTNIKSQINQSPLISNTVKITAVPEQIGSIGKFNGSKTQSDHSFTFVETAEELSLELRNSTRDFSHLILMITEEYQDDNFSVEDFQKELSTAESIKEGYDGVNFHYLIRKDGTIQRGRPIDIEPKQPGSEFNIEKSLIVAISAGYDAPFGTEGAELSFKLSSNLSLQLWLFLDVVFRMFPGLPIFADEVLVNIGFDVESYILSGWGKYNPNVSRPSNTLSALDRSFVVLSKAKED